LSLDLRDGLNGAAGVANIAKEQFTEAISELLFKMSFKLW